MKPVTVASFLLSAALAAAAPAANPAKNPPANSSGGVKRGLAYNDAKDTSLFPKDVASWGYNWASTPVAPGFQGPFASDHEYVPMLYDGSDAQWDENVENALKSGSKHLLAMNEPDQTKGNGGTQISAPDAAQIYKSKMNKYKGRAKLGAPAISAGGISWLKEFAQACNGACNIDFVPLHFYNSDPNPDIQATSMQGWLKETIPQVRNLFENQNMPIWVTEFAAIPDTKPQGSQDQAWNQNNVKYMDDMLQYLDENPAIARYSYYKVDNLADNGHLNAAGERYVKKD